jgi:hypothetical protein
MRFATRAEIASTFHGKRVAVVGSGPGCLDNKPGFVDSHGVVVRINNHKVGPAQGFRTDVHYSFYGSSIRKTSAELKAEGVRLVMCKCPDGKFIESEWHRKNGKPHGVDFSYIYRDRRSWWFCQTYRPSMQEFIESFDLLGRHIPSTGFSALLAVMSFEPASIFVTGMDFFSSKVHNVNEPWRPGNPEDPIGHAPERERAWLAKQTGMTYDKRLTEIMAKEA